MPFFYGKNIVKKSDSASLNQERHLCAKSAENKAQKKKKGNMSIKRKVSDGQRISASLNRHLLTNKNDEEISSAYKPSRLPFMGSPSRKETSNVTYS